MHPAIRIVIFLILLGVLAHARIYVPLIIFTVAVLIFPQHSFHGLLRTWRLFWRLRWLFLSITILYLLVTPGTPLEQKFLPWSPAYEGVLLVLQRLSGWLVILYLFALFSLMTTPAQWQSGIYWLLNSIRWPNRMAERVTLRMALTMQAVIEMQQQVTLQQTELKGHVIHSYIERITTTLIRAQQQAMQMPIQQINIDADTPPQWYEWSYPLLMTLGLTGLQQVIFSWR